MRPAPVLGLMLLLASCGEAPAPAAPPADATSAPLEQEALADERLARYRAHALVQQVLTAKARQTLEHADALELVGVDPDVYRRFGYEGLMDPEALGKVLAMLASGDGVRSRAVVEGAAARDEGLGLLYRALVDHGPAAACYDPRHAIVARRGEDRVVLLLCFACSYVVVLDGEGAGRYGVGDGGLKAWHEARLAEGGAR